MKDYVELFNGHKMPSVGLGTWQSPKDEVKVAINAALEAGYRHIDTAYNYLNEDAIGEVLEHWIQSGKVKREELFIVTKLPMIGNRPEDLPRFLKTSLKNLRLDYVDLYLIHDPVGMIGKHDLDIFPRDENGFVAIDTETDLIQLWKAMEDQVDAGLTKSIGLSNFNEEQIRRITKSSRIQPANLQVELHAYFQQRPLRKVCKELGITVCAYAPLGSPGRVQLYKQRGASTDSIPDILDNPVIQEIAQKHGKTTAQVLLRHLIQQEVIVIPKSTNPGRIRQNFQVFDFELSDEEMKKIDNLDRGDQGRSFDSGYFKGAEKHHEFPY